MNEQIRLGYIGIDTSRPTMEDYEKYGEEAIYQLENLDNLAYRPNCNDISKPEDYQIPIMVGELWAPILDTAGQYAISNYGRIKRMTFQGSLKGDGFETNTQDAIHPEKLIIATRPNLPISKMDQSVGYRQITITTGGLVTIRISYFNILTGKWEEVILYPALLILNNFGGYPVMPLFASILYRDNNPTNNHVNNLMVLLPMNPRYIPMEPSCLNIDMEDTAKLRYDSYYA